MRSGRAKPKLSRAVLVNITLIAAAAIAILGLFQVFDEYRDLSVESERIRKEHLSEYKRTLKAEVTSAVDYINYMRTQTKTRLQQSIRSRVEEATAIAGHIIQHFGPLHADLKVRDLIREALRPIRFNHGQGYFFAFDLNGVEQLFADRPELEGQNMLDLKGGQGEFVVRDMIDLAKEKGGGFYEYAWTKPGAMGNRHLKIAYIQLVKPLNWVIGTGEYLADVEDDIKQEVLARLEKIRFAGDNYVFAADWEGVSLTEPGKGKNNLNIKDVNGLEIVKELITLAKADGGYLTYVMPRFKGHRWTTKLSYVAGIPEWRWYVGSGVYVDDIEAEVAARRLAFRHSALIRSGITVSILGLMIGLAYLLARRFAGRAQADYARFEEFFADSGFGQSRLDSSKIHFAELASLAESANRMVEARRRGEEAEQTLERFFDLSVDLLCIANLEGHFLRVNPAFQRTLGWSAAELTGRPYLDFVHPEDKEATLAATAALSEGKAAIDFQSRYICADGSYRWLSWTMQPMLELGVTYATARDVSRQKEIEQELRSLADIAKSIPSGLFLYRLDPPDKLILVGGNPEAKKLTGIDAEEWRGREFNEIWPAARAAGITDNFLSVARTGRSWETEDTHYQDDRLNAAYRIRAFPLPGDRLGVAFEDITARKQAEEEQAKLQNMLQQAQKMEAIGTLAGGIAHDFNNILGAMMGYAEIAHQDALYGHTDPKDIDQIMKAAQRAKGLVKQILTFSRKTEPILQPLSLNQACIKAQSILEHTIPKMITIDCDLADGLPKVSADPTQMEQVLLNLCSNAADAMPDGGRLVLASRTLETDEEFHRLHREVPPGKYILLTVADTGCGMDQETRAHIFEPFFTTKALGKGTGLGLSTVYGIVTAHGGFIYCHSEPGQGTSFSIYLPVLSQELSGSDIEASVKAEAAPGGTEEILVVDDEEDLRTIAARMLRGAGYQVSEASSGEEALKIIAELSSPPDLVITDLGMPGMGGHKAMLEILANNPGAKIIVASGYGDVTQVKKSLEAGAAAYVAKPFNMAELRAAVRSVLDKS